MSKSTVPVGPTTVVGWSTALLAFAGALIAYFTGDHTAQSVTAVESAGIGLVALAVTNVGRYAQVRRIEGSLRPAAQGIIGGVDQLDPGLGSRIEAVVKDELGKLGQGAAEREFASAPRPLNTQATAPASDPPQAG